MKSAESIYYGKSTQELRSGHRNPLVKLLLLLTPLIFVAYHQVGRLLGWPRLGIADILLVALCLFLATILNFLDRERPRMFRRAFSGALFSVGLYYITEHPQGVLASAIGAFSKIYNAVPVLKEVVPESWLYLLFIYIAIQAVMNFDSRDALWLGRRLLLWWDRLYVTYVVTMTALSAMYSALPLRLLLSWRIAADKSALLKNPYLSSPRGWRYRFVRRWQIFALTIIWNNSSIAHSIDLLCEQRGYFRREYRDVIGRSLSNEDIVALMFLSLMIIFLVVPRIVDN